MFKKKLTVFQTLLMLISNQAGAINPATGLEDPDYVPAKEDPKPNPDGTYPKEFVEKLLREKGNWKTKAQELEDQLKAAKSAPPKKDETADEAAKALLKAKDEENKALKDRLAERDKERTDAMKLGTIKQEFDKNGGNAKAFELITRLVDTSKVLIDEDSGVVYGAEAEVKRIKEMAPEFFGKPRKGAADGDADMDNTHGNGGGDEEAKKKAAEDLKAKRLKKDKDGKNPLVDFYAAHGMIRK